MRKRISWVAVAALLVALLPLAAVSADAPGVDPPEVEAVLFPGGSAEIDKIVHAPYAPVPAMPDIYFLADTTGSMTDAIAQVKADAGAILAAIQAAAPGAAFGAGDYKDFPFDAYAFNNAAPITTDGGAAALAAITAWSAAGGADGSEGQFYALDQLISGADWRADATPIVVWFGDAPAHDPVCSAISGLPYDIDEASLTADLVAAGIRVIAISTITGFPNGLNDDPTLSDSNYSGICSTLNGTAGQADRIAAATGGVSLTGVAPEFIAAAILRGLESVAVDVDMYSDCGPPISTTFDPPEQTVSGGEDALFLETIEVSSDAPGGTYECNDYVRVNGEDLYTYVVTQGETTFNVGALASIQDIDSYYAYVQVSDVPAGPFNASSARIDIARSETSLLFLYTDGAELSLVVLHDRPEGQLPDEGPGTGGSVDMIVSNLPDGASWVVKDDPGEDPYAIVGGETTVGWNWIGCCTDGGAISGGLRAHLEGGSCVSVDPTFTSGIDDWLFLTGDRNMPGAYRLALDEPVEICAEQVIEHKTIKVPEGFLTGGGQIGKGSRGHNFGGNVGYLADFSVVGQWQFNDKEGLKMHSTSIEYLQFWNDGLDGPEPPDANANVAHFAGTARVKLGTAAWDDSCMFFAEAHDHGEPARRGDSDQFGIWIDCGDPPTDPEDLDSWDYKYPVEDLDAGNLQIHSGLKD